MKLTEAAKLFTRVEKIIIAIVLALFVVLMITIIWPTPAKCWGCWGGPCVTSAACVAGCHCINGTCG